MNQTAPQTLEDEDPRLILSFTLLLALVFSGFVWALRLGEVAPAFLQG